MGFVVAIGAMVALGLWAGSLIGLVGGITTIVTTDLLFHQADAGRPRASLLQRSLFNISMRLLAVTGAGFVFIATGGTPGTPLTITTVLPLACAVIAYQLIGLGLLVGVIRLQTGRHLLEIWRQDWQWTTPISIAGGIMGGGALAFAYTVTGGAGLLVYMLPVVATGYAFRLYVDHTRTYVDQLESVNQRLEATNLDLLYTLSSVIDAYDLYTFGHSTQVARYAGAIAQTMDLPAHEQARIVRGALIHDIGKIGVTDAITGKPGRLTQEEYDLMKLHTVIGAEIVKQMPQLRELVPIVRSHHERWDGRGYPDGLKEEESPLCARIIAVADSVEAMLSDRPYKSPLSLPEVIEEVKRNAGKQFDPRVAAAFLAVAESQGSALFINSAAKVSQDLKFIDPVIGAEWPYLAKKSMSLAFPKIATPSG